MFYRFRFNPLIILIFNYCLLFSSSKSGTANDSRYYFLYSTKFLVKQDIWKYLLLVVLAASFHSSAFLLFLLHHYIWLERNQIYLVTVTHCMDNNSAIRLHIINFDFFFDAISLNFTVSVQEAQRVGAEINFDLVYNIFVLLFLLRKNVPKNI